MVLPHVLVFDLVFCILSKSIVVCNRIHDHTTQQFNSGAFKAAVKHLLMFVRKIIIFFLDPKTVTCLLLISSRSYIFFLTFLGTKHKTILEARSGLGPIKAYPRLGPKPSPDQGGELTSDPNTQERTFHCEICNVRVNSELQLKQVRKTQKHVRLIYFFISVCTHFYFMFQHISSRRHRDGVAGKPNPLLSRHKKRTDFMVELQFISYSQYSLFVLIKFLLVFLNAVLARLLLTCN